MGLVLIIVLRREGQSSDTPRCSLQAEHRQERDWTWTTDPAVHTCIKYHHQQRIKYQPLPKDFTSKGQWQRIPSHSHTLMSACPAHAGSPDDEANTYHKVLCTVCESRLCILHCKTDMGPAGTTFGSQIPSVFSLPSFSSSLGRHSWAHYFVSVPPIGKKERNWYEKQLL